jgi:serine/threonine-protein kinase
VAEALDYLHRKRIVHRDLKPANLFVVRDPPRVILGDFGLVLIEDEQLQAAIPNYVPTQAHLILGSPGYMAPEQATGGIVDGRSDLFALGVLFYEMLQGRLPYPNSSFAEYISTLAVGVPPPPFEVPLPEGAQELIFRMLARKPDDRYQTPGQMSVDLVAIGEESRISASRITGRTRTLEPPTETVRASRALTLGPPPQVPEDPERVATMAAQREVVWQPESGTVRRPIEPAPVLGGIEEFEEEVRRANRPSAGAGSIAVAAGGPPEATVPAPARREQPLSAGTTRRPRPDGGPDPDPAVAESPEGTKALSSSPARAGSSSPQGVPPSRSDFRPACIVTRSTGPAHGSGTTLAPGSVTAPPPLPRVDHGPQFAPPLAGAAYESLPHRTSDLSMGGDARPLVERESGCSFCGKPLDDAVIGCSRCRLVMMPWTPWILDWALFALSLACLLPIVCDTLKIPNVIPPLGNPAMIAVAGIGVFLVAIGLRTSRGWAYVLVLLVLLGLVAVTGTLLAIAVGLLPHQWPQFSSRVLGVLAALAGQGVTPDLVLRTIKESYLLPLAGGTAGLLAVTVQMLSRESREQFLPHWSLSALILFPLAATLLVWPFATVAAALRLLF